MREIMAGKAWGLKPWEFQALVGERRAILMASFIVDLEIQNYYKSEESRVLDKSIKKPPPTGRKGR